MEEISLGVIIAQIINFGILLFIFKHFLGKKIVAVLLERREKLAELEKVDENIKVKLNKADEEAGTIIEQARKKAGEIEKSAEIIAKNNKDKIISDAEYHAGTIIDGAKKEIEQERLTMVNSIKSKVVDLSIRLNEKLFDKERVNKDFMEKELSSINI